MTNPRTVVRRFDTVNPANAPAVCVRARACVCARACFDLPVQRLPVKPSSQSQTADPSSWVSQSPLWHVVLLHWSVSGMEQKTGLSATCNASTNLRERNSVECVAGDSKQRTQTHIGIALRNIRGSSSCTGRHQTTELHTQRCFGSSWNRPLHLGPKECEER